MAQKRNSQTVSFQSAAALINIVNPSPTALMQVWSYQVTGPGAAANVGFQNGPGVLGGYGTLAAGGTLSAPGNGIEPIFTVDPNANFVISNPNTVALGGWVRISN